VRVNKVLPLITKYKTSYRLGKFHKERRAKVMEYLDVVAHSGWSSRGVQLSPEASSQLTPDAPTQLLAPLTWRGPSLKHANSISFLAVTRSISFLAVAVALSTFYHSTAARARREIAPCSTREGKQRHAARARSAPPMHRKKSVKKKRGTATQVAAQPDTGPERKQVLTRNRKMWIRGSRSNLRPQGSM
jgi:hypothetical protein